MSIYIKNKPEINLMRTCGKIHALIFKALEKKINPGISTQELDNEAQKLCKKFKVKASFLGYHGFPASICTSVNEEVVHGIPKKEKILKIGDIISIDLGIFYQGFHTDGCKTFAVGDISKENQKLLKVTKKALFNAIAKIKANIPLSSISKEIQKTAEKEKLNIVKNLTGHGIGKALHEKPQILNFYLPDDNDIILKAGMTLAIEPILIQGQDKIFTLKDKWTIISKDKSLSAHFEHTVLVTDKGSEILT